MSITSISPYNLMANHAEVQTDSRFVRQVAAAYGDKALQQKAKAAATDTVTISPNALQMASKM